MVGDNNRETDGRIMAIDFGSVHTGIAVSDPTRTLVRPLKDIKEARTVSGLNEIAAAVIAEAVVLVVVGMPVSLDGSRGEQAEKTELFINELDQLLDIPVKTWDERYTSKIARRKGREAEASEHGIAACLLLEDYLKSLEGSQSRNRH